MSSKSWFSVVVSAVTVLAAARANATYSIVAVDRATAQVGGAVTSCVTGSSVSRVFQAVPGVGAIHAQARTSIEGRRAGAALLRQGASAAEALAEITSRSFDPFASTRQYGIVTLDGEAVGFTGDDNGDYAGDVQRVRGAFVYSIQGNILTSPRVLQQADAGFARPACDLAGRLVAALAAGAQRGEGDARCRPGSPSDAAFLEVDNADGTPFVRIDVRGSRNPIGELMARFSAFRTAQGCYAAPTP